MSFSIGNRPFCYALLLIIVAACSSNPSDSFDPNNGMFQTEQVQIETHALNARFGVLMAGTDQGAYRKQVDGENEWNQVGLNIDSAKVAGFIQLNDEEMMAAVNYSDPQTDQPKLYETQNEGSSWKGVQVEYDTTKLRFFRIQDLILDPDNNDRVYANAGVIATSSDRGKTWKILRERFFSQFLTLQTSHPQILWTGGSTNIFSPYIAKSEDGGQNWSVLNENFSFNTETNVYDVILDPRNPDNVLAGAGGAIDPANVIRKSTDGGQTWKTVFKGINTRIFAHSARNSGWIYASGRNADGSLFFAASGDFGESWQQVEWDNSPAGVQVNDMVSVMENGREVLYLGTNKGIYSYKFEG